MTAASLVDIDYFNSNKKTVCVVTCKKSSEPIFCKLGGARDGVPLVRYGSSTTQPSYQEWEKWKTEYFVEDLSTI